MRDYPVNKVHDVLHQVLVGHCDVASRNLEDWADAFR